jgi:tetratricopeptide (TPR) repeat protein
MMNYKAMFKMKFIQIVFVFILLSISVSAQLSQGIEYLNSEMYTTGKIYFKTLYTDLTLKPEVSYYLGETYRLSGKPDSAAIYYELGLQQEKPNALCMVGKAGLLMSTDPTQAADLIKKANSVKEYKKNPALHVALAKVYASIKQFDKAFEILNAAKVIDKNYINIYLTEGDIFYNQNKTGEAASKFESALSFDASCKTAYFKLARIYYLGKMYPQSLEFIEKSKTVDEHFPPVLKLSGDIYYEQGKYAKAIGAYSEYLQSDEAVLADHSRYAYALFFNKEYKKSIEELNQIMPLEPGNLVFKRLMAYNLYETGEFKTGLDQMKDFFASSNPSEVIVSDYKYFARLLQKNNQDSLAITHFKKATENSQSPLEFNKEISQSFEKMKNYTGAAAYLEKHFKTNKNIVPADLLLWGRNCYFAAGAIDSAAIAQNPAKADERKALYLKADSIFGDFAIRYPDHYMGYFWRARVNAILDPNTESGLAKPHYEKVAEILEKTNNTERKKEMIESYQYLGYYYYLKEDKTNSLIYFNKIIAIDPNNSVALEAIKGIEQL